MKNAETRYKSLRIVQFTTKNYQFNTSCFFSDEEAHTFVSSKIKKTETMQIKNLKRTAVAFLLASCFLLIPTENFGQEVTVMKGNFRTTNDDGTRTITIKNDKNDFRIEYEGEITVSDDDKDIIGISRGGYIEIRKSRFGKRRRIVIEAESGGRLSKAYFVGRKEVSYDPDGKNWLAEILPDIVRSTKIAAESRVDRFYKKGGVGAVMREIEEMDSDYVKAAYIKILLKKNLSNSELVRVIKTAGEEIKSDYYVSQILKANQKAFLATDATRSAYIKAAAGVKSDHYVSQILKAAVNDSSINDKQMSELLEITKSIGSAHYLTQILSSIMDKRELNKQNMNTIMNLSDQIKSDHYRTQILRKALKKDGLSKANYDAFLRSLDKVKSDHYTTQVINDLMVDDMSSADLTKLLNIVGENVQSDHYATNIYKKLAKNRNITEAQLIQLMESASKSIGSDYYLSNVLVAYSDKVRRSSQKVKDAYAKAAKSIGSDTYYGRAMKAMY